MNHLRSIIEALEECHEYFDGRADAEYTTDSASPTGNEEMRLLVQVNDALALARMIDHAPKMERSA
jgi:hypothetical protein